MSPKAPADKAPEKKWRKKTPERGLGRGLSSLLGDQRRCHSDRDVWGYRRSTNGSDIQQTPGTSGALSLSGLREVPIEWINVGPWQPRRRFDKLALDELRLRSGKMALFNLYCCVHIPITNRVFSWLRVNGDGAPHNWQRSRSSSYY